MRLQAPKADCVPQRTLLKRDLQTTRRRLYRETRAAFYYESLETRAQEEAPKVDALRSAKKFVHVRPQQKGTVSKWLIPSNEVKQGSGPPIGKIFSNQKHFKIASLNVQGLPEDTQDGINDKIDQLLYIMEMEDIDILAIQETKRNTNDVFRYKNHVFIFSTSVEAVPKKEPGHE